MLHADEMPDDNADLASIQIDFPRLPNADAADCPVTVRMLLDYLSDEVPDGQLLTSDDLSFLRTADVEGTSYWIWRFQEPDGEPAYVTVAVAPDGAQIVGYGPDHYGLTPEQFILGDHHQVF